VGIDVAEGSCVAAVDGAKPRKFPLSGDGPAMLTGWSKGQLPGANILAVMEHTGVYSEQWAGLLFEHGMGSAIVNSSRVKFYTMAMGVRHKTDKSDALAILEFAKHFKPVMREPKSDSERDLTALTKDRATFVRMRATMATQAKGHKRQPGIPELLEPERSAVLAVMNESIKSYESRIKKLIKADAKMDRAAVILDSMPGIGDVNIAQFCIHLKVIMDCNAKEVTALTGFSPKHNQSGKSLHGRSRIDKQGWGEMRKNLYMAANCAARHCPRFREFKERLVAKGKTPRLAVVAVARKMLVIAHSLLHKDELFDPNYQIT
jgi:transposase